MEDFSLDSIKQAAKGGLKVFRILGTYKGTQVVQYELAKQQTESERTVYCVINRKAASYLEKEGVEVVTQKNRVWHYKPEGLVFEGNHNTHPLKITFH